jgi:hypothetical protein
LVELKIMGTHPKKKAWVTQKESVSMRP